MFEAYSDLEKETGNAVDPCNKTDCVRFGKWGVKEVIRQEGILKKVWKHYVLLVAERSGAPDCFGCVHFSRVDLYRKLAEDTQNAALRHLK